MLDFLLISTKNGKRGVTEIYPKFIIKKSEDLMIRGGDFYAVWVEERGFWSTDEQDVLRMIDRELDNFIKEHKDAFNGEVRVLHMWDADSGMIDRWHKYCQKQMRDNFHTLDERLIFANTKVKKEDYASRQLTYSLENGNPVAYEKLMSVLYSPEERQKIEWAIGSVISGDSRKIQKFVVLYGEGGTGKSTVLNIIQKLFDGYCASFESKSLGSANAAFALEPFRLNPLVAVEHDGNLSRIEDNTRLNSLVSHEEMVVNEKHKSLYSTKFRTFLFLGTNKPVKITDAKSGLIRRLIDVSPTGNKLPFHEYLRLTEQVNFELGAIACHCQEVYLANKNAYDNYIPIAMLGASNDFYNFMWDSYFVFKKEDGTGMKAAWEMYKTYCDEAKVPHPYSWRVFQEELKNYFREYYKERYTLPDGKRVRNYCKGFRTEKFEEQSEEKTDKPANISWIAFEDKSDSIFERDCADCPAQYASENGTPLQKWERVTTKLSDLDTSRLHFVQIPQNHIVIDFDIPNPVTGMKSLELNLEAANKFPPTYAELSKSGAGIHLHYIYAGDPSKLSRVYGDHIEIKVFTGNSSLRRQLTKCNDKPIAAINSGLPLKGEKMVDFEAVKSEQTLRKLIKKNLNKEIHPATKPSVDFIHKILDDAYKSDLRYDVTDMRNAVLTFAANSTNQADYCVKLVNKMKFKSDEPSENVVNDDETIIFFDVEVFPNLFLVNWKAAGEGKNVVRMINPLPTDIEELIRHRLIGFNCRRYDNHILYARLIGYDNERLFRLSQKIISEKDPNCFFGEAYNISYADIWEFSSKKQSLKKFEIELGIHHKELGLPWDKPVPEDMWEKVAEYCDNDVLATEAVFNARQADFTAQQILAELAGGSVNDNGNALAAKFIFEGNKHPQDQFCYRDMGDESSGIVTYVQFDEHGWPVYHGRKVWEFTGPPIPGKDYALFNEDMRPIFPGYKYENGKSTYRGEEVGEGGYVYAEPGIYTDVALLDIASMHPHSAINENVFGTKYTQRFKDIVDARLAIKHQEFDAARKMLNGALEKYLRDEKTADALAYALKIVINKVYGMSSANFDNPFRDPRNKDNIIAKRGALFMINLKHEVQDRGFTVAHIKTDSIKIPNATPEIIDFVMSYGEVYGYRFEHEATYERMCLVNDAVYIAKYKDGKHAGEWTATGTQFQVSYVFKTLFSKEPIIFDDLCETKSVSTALYLDLNENLPDVSWYENEVKDIDKQLAKGGLNDEEREELTQARKVYQEHIERGHNYRFVGKVGRFCPVKPGSGGGLLMRQTVNKQTGETGYAAATGTKNYRWLESEFVKDMGREDDIDRDYYRKLVDDAVKAISKYGDFDRFASDEVYIPD